MSVGALVRETSHTKVLKHLEEEEILVARGLPCVAGCLPLHLNSVAKQSQDPLN